MVLDGITLGGETTIDSSGLVTDTSTLNRSNDLRVEDTRSHFYINRERGERGSFCIEGVVRRGNLLFLLLPRSISYYVQARDISILYDVTFPNRKTCVTNQVSICEIWQ